MNKLPKDLAGHCQRYVTGFIVGKEEVWWDCGTHLEEEENQVI